MKGNRKSKEHLTSVIGQVSPCMAPLEVIGQTILELENRFAKLDEDNTRKKQINVACCLDYRVYRPFRALLYFVAFMIF